MNRNNCCVEMVKVVPEVERCCWCVPLRPGIIIFGYINVFLSAMVIGCLIVLTELRRVDQDANFEDMTSTVLYSIFGMSVILNILLLVAGHQKDEAMLRLYSYYAVATTMAALIPTSMLVHRYLYMDVGAAMFTIAMQCYVIVLVRSEVLKLEKQRLQLMPDPRRRCDEEIDTPDTEVLLETTFH